MGSNGDVVTLKAATDCVLKISFNSIENALQYSEYDLKLMNLNEDLIEEHFIDYKTKIQLSAVLFSKISKDLLQFSEKVQVSCVNKTIIFKSACKEKTGIMNFSDTSKDLSIKEKIVIQSENDVKQYFSIKLINKAIKATSISKIVNIYLKTGHPMSECY
ncbi:MAG: hypothetical protein QM535_15050 [Limnohabitans sp.]|nr:hypothetical protein [Limnohabitans sp.]